jgi:hypothetical protein
LPHMLVFPQISRTVFVDGENICGRYPLNTLLSPFEDAVKSEYVPKRPSCFPLS